MIVVPRRVVLGGLGGLVLLGLSWLGLLVHVRRELGLENHLVRNLQLPFVPLGRPAIGPDGRIFVVCAGGQLLSVGADGQLLWNRRLPGKVAPQPVMVSSDLLLLRGAGVLHGYSLGGELLFTAQDGGALTDLPCADGRGDFYVIDRQGDLRGFAATGRARSLVPLRLVGSRQVVLLPGGQLAAAGGTPAGGWEVVVTGPSGPSGAIAGRLPLQAPPQGLAASPLPEEAGAVSAGDEVISFSAAATPSRRLRLGGRVRSAPLLLGDGSVYVLAEDRGGVGLCRAPGPGPCVPAMGRMGAAVLPIGPILGRDGRVYVAFSEERALSPGYQGVLAVTGTGEGGRYRQALPGAVAASGLALTWGGGVVAVVEGQPYLWQLDGGSERPGDRAPWHPWPMPTGNPTNSLRPWPF